MQIQMSSNACFYDDSYRDNLDNRIASNIEPYDSVVTRFQHVLQKGDALLVHLMLKQVLQSPSKKLMSDMLNALVHHAVNI